jgi:surfeit locus 1 family protein
MTKYRMRVSLVPTIAALVVLSVTVSLGNWQMRRADEKERLQVARDEALAATPLALLPQPMPAESVDGRRVVAEGVLDAARTVYLDNRTRQGIAGFHVFTPLRIVTGAPDGGTTTPSAATRVAPAIESGDRWVLVMRGWVARDPTDRGNLPAVPTPSDPVRIEGLAQATLAQALMLSPAPPPAPHERLWALVTLERYAGWSGLPLQPFFVRQTSELPDGLARDWVQPGSGIDKHYGYAFQWYALAVAALALWLWFALRRPRSDAHDPGTDSRNAR